MKKASGFQKTVPCPACNGSCKAPVGKCRRCDGTGWTSGGELTTDELRRMKGRFDNLLRSIPREVPRFVGKEVAERSLIGEGVRR